MKEVLKAVPRVVLRVVSAVVNSVKKTYFELIICAKFQVETSLGVIVCSRFGAVMLYPSFKFT
jgi:hypothetical protein